MSEVIIRNREPGLGGRKQNEEGNREKEKGGPRK
jgi:hypothetical protein